MSEWIKVSDRLPKNGSTVLCLAWEKYHYVCEVEYDDFFNDEGLVIKATHWMPLPEPPQD